MIELECLVKAGWRPGRHCDISDLSDRIRDFGFSLSSAASHFLEEFYGLSIVVPLIDCSDVFGFVCFDPMHVLRLISQSDIEYIQTLIGKPACPIGTTSGNSFFIFMDGDGRTYLLDFQWSLFANLADDAQRTIKLLCDGRNARVDSIVLNNQRQLTPHVIRAENEQDFWNSDAYPNSQPFLPPTSLSPCRKPPTWCALVNTLESILKESKSPQNIMVTCGGMAILNHKMHFVAHCENCLYMRRKARVRVSTPPPGVRTDYGTGEILFMNDVQ